MTEDETIHGVYPGAGRRSEFDQFFDHLVVVPMPVPPVAGIGTQRVACLFGPFGGRTEFEALKSGWRHAFNY